MNPVEFTELQLTRFGALWTSHRSGELPRYVAAELERVKREQSGQGGIGDNVPAATPSGTAGGLELAADAEGSSGG